MKVQSKKDVGVQVCGITTLLSIQVFNYIYLLINHNCFYTIYFIYILNFTLLTIFIERTNNDNAVEAVDFYHRYKVSKYDNIVFITFTHTRGYSKTNFFLYVVQEDIQLLKKLNMDGFRFSFSWPRIFPREYIHQNI